MPSYKVQNPSATRDFVANVGGTWHTIKAGESMTTDDPRLATTLGEYGATVEPISDALDAHAHGNRMENARFASAPASEASILERQVTVDPVTGVADRTIGPSAPQGAVSASVTDMTVAVLDEALKEAGLPTTGNKADKQARLANYLAAEAEISEAPIPLDGAGGTGEPATGASYREEGDAMPGEIIQTDEAPPPSEGSSE